MVKTYTKQKVSEEEYLNIANASKLVGTYRGMDVISNPYIEPGIIYLLNEKCMYPKFPKPTKRIKKKKHIRRERKTPISKLKKQLLGLVKEIVRKRDDYTCQKCGKKVEGSNCHVSHVIPVSAGNRLAFDPLNMKILCYHDHINWWHKNPIESGAWFQKKFPDRYAYLQQHRHETVDWKESDYLEMISKVGSLK